MTITVLPARNEYTASGGETVFNYTFKIYESSDLLVYITPAGQEANDDTDLTIDYVVDTVTLKDPEGGYLTLNSPVNAGDRVTIVSGIPADRVIDYQLNGDFRPDVVNDDYDRAISLIKQIYNVVSRTLTFGESLQNAQSLSLPEPSPGQFLKWNGESTGLENVDIVADATSADGVLIIFPSVAAMKSSASPLLVTGVNVKTQGYYAPGDGGGATYLVATAQTVDGHGDHELNNGNVALVQVEGLTDAKVFGAVGNGIADDTDAIQAGLDRTALSITSGRYPVVGVTSSKYLTMTPDSRLVYIGAQNGTCLYIDADWGEVYVDGDNNDVTGVRITDTGSQVPAPRGSLCFVENITASATSSLSISGVSVVAPTSVKIEKIVVKNLANTGQANGSMPQAVSVIGTADNTIIDRIEINTTASGLVTGENTGTTKVGSIICKNNSDNGVYQLGGELQIESVSYEGNEEAVVLKGEKAQIGSIFLLGSWLRGLALEDVAEVHVGRISAIQGSGLSSGNLMNLRTGNTSSGKLFVGRVEGSITGTTVFSFNDGTLDYFSLDSLDVDFYYDPLVATSATGFIRMQSCKSFNINSLKCKIIDTTDTLTNSTRFQMTAPTTNLDANSFIRNVDILPVGSDGVTPSTFQFRGVGFARALIHVRGCRWDTNPYIREIGVGVVEPDSIGSKPTAGEWRAGTILYDGNVSPGAGSKTLLYYCKTGGTPGVWAAFDGSFDA